MTCRPLPGDFLREAAKGKSVQQDVDFRQHRSRRVLVRTVATERAPAQCFIHLDAPDDVLNSQHFLGPLS